MQSGQLGVVHQRRRVTLGLLHTGPRPVGLVDGAQVSTQPDDGAVALERVARHVQVLDHIQIDSIGVHEIDLIGSQRQIAQRTGLAVERQRRDCSQINIVLDHNFGQAHIVVEGIAVNVA